MKPSLLIALTVGLLLCSCSLLVGWDVSPTPVPEDAALFVLDSAYLLSQVAGDMDTEGKLAHYGPVVSRWDICRWDGSNYAYATTQSGH